tara:strand:- start:73 stop:672 length:600 start_codon:yes stop_codon:yes gene_type:complete
MRTNDELIESILQILNSIDIKKSKDIINKADKSALLDYINEEFLNVDDYIALLTNITLEKEDILEILYQLISFINIKTIDSDVSVTEQLLEEASKHGFTWPDSDSCFNKVEEEFLELKDAIKKNDKENIEEEIGDLLFTLHCYANIKKFNFEYILKKANTKFEKRFKKLLDIAKAKNINLAKSSFDIKEKLWKNAKDSL